MELETTEMLRVKTRDALLAAEKKGRRERVMATGLVLVLLRDIDRLLAERAAPLPAEVEEMRTILLQLAEWEQLVELSIPDDLRAAAALLSRWPKDAGWQPISTAPKDGTNILLTDGVDVVSGYWSEPVTNQITIRPAMWRVHWRIGQLGAQPTHWMPLPPAPKEETNNA